MKTHPQNSFLKFYVMTSPEIDLYGMAHVKVDFIPLQKMYIKQMLGKFVWTTCFVQCVMRSPKFTTIPDLNFGPTAAGNSDMNL